MQKRLIGKMGSLVVFACLFACQTSQTSASELSTQEILEQLKAHQDQVKTIQADFAMTVFGVGQFKLDQSGTYTYAAPDQVVMEFQKPQHQVVKTQGQDSYISLNDAPFQKLPANKEAGANNDLFYYHFLKQFYLDIDFKNKPSESNRYKILAYQKNEDGTMASADSVLNLKAAEFIYDRDRGLVTQINLMGQSTVPPMEVKLIYEEKSGCWVPKSVFTRVITPGGAIASVVKLENKKVEKK